MSLGSFPGASGTTDTNLFLEFTSDQPVLSFASVINNASGDPFAIVAAADAAQPGADRDAARRRAARPREDPARDVPMGSPDAERGRDSDETQHEVTLSSDYYIGKTVVTQAQWQAVMGSNPSQFLQLRRQRVPSRT